MKNLILIFTILASSVSIAANDQNNEFSDSDAVLKEMSAEKLRYRFEIVGEILIFNKSGTRLLTNSGEKRSWQFGSLKSIVTNWSYKHKNLPEVALHHEWDVSKDGQLTAKITQYKSMSRDSGDVKFGKLLTETSYVIENFDSINVVIEQTEQRRVVVKFSPRLWTDENPENIAPIAINGKDIIIHDNKGELWASRVDNSDGNNVYFGVTTHRGSIFLSYVPFKGAKELGSAKNNKIWLQDGDLKLHLQSADNFLPRGISAKVYGYVDLNRRTNGPFSVRSYGSDKEKNFLAHIQ